MARHANLLDFRWWPEGSYEIGSVGSSILPSFHLTKCFLGTVLVFSKCWHGARNLMKLFMTKLDFLREKKFPSKIGKMGQQKSFEFNEKLGC